MCISSNNNNKRPPKWMCFHLDWKLVAYMVVYRLANFVISLHGMLLGTVKYAVVMETGILIKGTNRTFCSPQL